MSKNKELKKSLKGPDAFQTSVVSGFEQALHYKGILIALIIAAVAGTVGLAGYQHYQAKQSSDRVNELGKVEQAYEKETEALNEQRNKLREELGKLTEPTAEGKEPNLSAEQQKRKGELQSQINGMVADHSGTLKQYQEFYAKYKQSPEGWMAGTRAAGILVDQKKYAEAKTLLSEILNNTRDSFFYQINGRMMYINVLDELNEFDPALGEVDKLVKELDRIDREAKAANEVRKKEKKAEVRNPAEDLRPQVLLTKGRLLMRKGDKEAATKVFDEIMSKHKESNEARQAMSYKALLL